MNIEPMEVAEIKEEARRCLTCQFPGCYTCRQKLHIILAWAHAEARARMYQAFWQPGCSLNEHMFGRPEAKTHDCPAHRTFERWLKDTLQEIGWLDDLRADHEDNHRMNLDEVYGGKGARKCQWCEEEDEKEKAI